MYTINMPQLNDRLEEWEMKANWQKTRVMRIGRKLEGYNVEINGQKVKQVGGDEESWGND